MILVTVELLPGGDASKATVLGRATITNDGTGSLIRGNYKAEFTHKGRRWGASRVEDFPRQSLNVWELLRECLEVVYRP